MVNPWNREEVISVMSEFFFSKSCVLIVFNFKSNMSFLMYIYYIPTSNIILYIDYLTTTGTTVCDYNQLIVYTTGKTIMISLLPIACVLPSCFIIHIKLYRNMITLYTLMPASKYYIVS